MLSRKQHDKKGIPFSEEMIQSITGILNQTYQKECTENNKIFKIYGETYPTEIILVISLTEGDHHKIPTACFLSADLEDKSRNNPLEDLIDNSSFLLDMIFSITYEELIEEYSDIWKELESSTGKYFYKITRENIELTLEANKILGDEA